MRGFAVTAIFLILVSVGQAQWVLQPTTVSDVPEDEIGSRRTTRPAETAPASQLKTEERTQLSEALNFLPGIQAREQGGPALAIRGSQSSARVLALEDGTPLNFADGVGFNPIYVSTENLDSVTLLKGPSSSLFGHDAVAGVVEFHPAILNAPKFFLGYGSFNSTRVFAGAPLLKGGTHVQLTAYESHTNGDFPYSIPRTGASGTRERNDSETVRATLRAEHQAGAIKWKSFNLVARQIGSAPGSVDFPYPSSFNNWGALNSLVFNAPLGESFAIGSRTSFKYQRQEYSGSVPNQTVSIRQGMSFIKKWNALTFEIFDDYTHETFEASYLSSGKQTFGLNEAGASAFLPLNETLSFQPALRVSNENGGVVPSLGFIGLSDEDWRYFLNYSEGFAPPSITQKYAQMAGFSGNPDLSPEHSYEFDAGFEKITAEHGVRFEAFSRELNNLIEQRVLTPGTYTPVNVGRARATGFEITGQTGHDPLLTGAIAYTDNKEVDTNTPVPLSPQTQVSVSAKKAWNSFSLNVQDVYWTSYFDRDITTGQLVELYAWNSLDLFLNYDLTQNLSLALAATNVLNQPRELSIGYPEPQRAFNLTLRGTL